LERDFASEQNLKHALEESKVYLDTCLAVFHLSESEPILSGAQVPALKPTKTSLQMQEEEMWVF
jgi:hypothetical protein